MKEFVLKKSFDLSNCKIDYQKELNKEQLEVVLNGSGPCLVLAGAGSGKTRTITYRVAYLLENGVPPENVLLVTFTNKASKEMVSRVEQLLGSYPKGLWGGTFHSIANRILRRYAPQINRTPNFTILDAEDMKDLIKICIKELNVDTSERRFPSANNLMSMISYSRNAARKLEEVVEEKYPNFFDLIPTIVRVAELYDLHKRQADALDFDDLLLLLRDLLSNNPAICNALASQFQFVLVDEYQDTNVIQADIVRMLSSVHNNVLVVGDDAQSIYSFRAAEIRNILNYPEVYSGTKTYRLTTNYRSTPEILGLANASIKNNCEQFKKELLPVLEGFEKPNVVPAQTSPQEAQYIAEQVLELREEGIKMEQIAVLFRAAFHSQALEFELMKRDIPYEYRGGMKFFERAHVKDVVSHLRLVANIKDEMAWMRVLCLQPGVGLVTAGKIYAQIKPVDTIDDVIEFRPQMSARPARGWEQFISTARKMIIGNRHPADMIRAVITSGYRDYLEAEYPDFMERLEDLEQFALFAEGYDSLTTFLDEVSLTEEYGAAREKGKTYDEERIILSTVHQAKGLEWDVVFVINLTEGKFPNQRAMDEKGGLEEERRLFYVATTRARRYLFLTYPIMSGHDTLFINPPSPFVQELPEELYEQVVLKQKIDPYRSSSSGWDNSDPIIVFDSLGDEVDTPKKTGGFLGDY